MSSKFKSLRTPLRAAASQSTSKTLPRTAPGAAATAAAAPAAAAKQRFTTTSRSSPFRSFITTGLRGRSTLSQSNDFAYDLSKDELTFMGSYKSPMKAVPDRERELLKTGQREAYLALRYEYAPERKYNYPEATSWRIGWLQNQQSRQHQP